MTEETCIHITILLALISHSPSASSSSHSCYDDGEDDYVCNFNVINSQFIMSL